MWELYNYLSNDAIISSIDERIEEIDNPQPPPLFFLREIKRGIRRKCNPAGKKNRGIEGFIYSLFCDLGSNWIFDFS